MHSPINKLAKQNASNSCSTTSRKQDESCEGHKDCPHMLFLLEQYQKFKRKLLIAMQDADPLQILQGGIFEEFEEMLSINSKLKPKTFTSYNEKQKSRNGIMGEVSDFQTVLQTYEISDNLQITQLQRRSLSCSSKFRQKQLNAKKMQMKNIEFVLWNNAFRQIDSLKQEQKKIDDFFELRKQIQKVTRTLEQKQMENQCLRHKLIEVQSFNSIKKDVQQTSNEDDHRLEYLLKQKQLQKKLQQAKDEIEHLRSLLERNAQEYQTPQIFRHESEQVPLNSLSIMREKIDNQGRVKRALQQLWGNQLKSQCNQCSN